MRRTLPIILLLLISLSCTEEPPTSPGRTNPLDENNPATGGDPFNLGAEIAGGGVRLTWQPVDVGSVVGYNIHRKVDGGAFELEYQVSGKNTSSFIDTLIQNGHKYTYYIRTRNQQGQESTSNTAHIEINNTPYLSIDQGNFTPTRQVNLTLLAFGAVSMQIGTPDLSGAQWVNYITTATIELETGAGTKTVQARFAYADGDTSWVVSDNIQPQPLNPMLNIAHDSTYTPTRQVWLFPSAQGSNLMCKYSEDSTFTGINWQTITESVEFTLSTGAGTKTVYAKFKNDFEIESQVLSDNIQPQPMNPSFNINNNAAETELTAVTLFLSAQGSNLKYMASENSGFSGADWQNYLSQANFTLSSGAGSKTVYVKFKNDFEVETSTLQDAISYVYCIAPSNLSASVNETSITLTWQDNSNVEQGYKIERKISGGSYAQVGTTNANAEIYTDNGLTAGITYYYRVCAYNSQGNSGYSNEISPSTSINAPTDLNATMVSLSEIDLTWQDNSNVEEGYQIERKVSGGTYSQIATVSQNTATYSDTGLQENTTYWYRVRAYIGSNNSSYSNEADATTTYPAGYEQTFALGTTGETIEMVWIPSGSFMQGRYSGEQGSNSSEDPQHLVTFANGFWLGKYEVTQAQWEAIAGPWTFYFDNHPDYPAETVSWNDITNTFLPALNSQSGGNLWRLPSESEWEYACRAGTETRFYWGDDLNETEIGNYAWYTGNSGSQTHEVGTREPNAWNLYDMSGNVWEWVEDYWHSNYTGAPTNGDPWLSPTSSSRVLRGGSWYYYGNYCRSAYRFSNTPSYRSYNRGFRLVRSS